AAQAMAEAADGLRTLQEAISVAVQGVVAKSLDESRAHAEAELKAAMSQALAQALAQSPSQADLQRLARDLRADVTYELEKVAAEKGWISLSEVQERFGGSSAGGGP